MFSAVRTRTQELLSQENSERGSVLVLYGILGPAMIVLIFSVIQVAMVGHANNLLTAAAELGVEDARGLNGGDGQGTAQNFLDSSGATSLVKNVNITEGGGARGRRVVVSGDVISLIPGVPSIRIERQARGPAERWTDTP